MFCKNLQGWRLILAYWFYIMLLTDIVLFYFSAILHAKRDFDKGIEIFVIFSALWKNNPPFPHSYPHIHNCHLYLSKASKLQKMDVITPNMLSCKHIFGLHNFLFVFMHNASKKNPAHAEFLIVFFLYSQFSLLFGITATNSKNVLLSRQYCHSLQP